VIDAIVHRLLEAEIGLDLDSVGASALRAAVAARMAARGVRDPAVYASLLESRDEREALVDVVVIPETWFFRDRVPFELLAERATPGLRVLSAPCSSGEEPYSIAMALLDAGLAPGGFRIDGLDISAPLLARARAGIYGGFSFRGDDLGFRERHFTRAEGEEPRYELSPAVRAAVTFVRDNVLSPVWLGTERPYDLIFCRNLLIYLTEPARRRVLDTLANALAPDGRIVVGHAEALEVMDARFVAVAKEGAFTYEMRRPPQGLAPQRAPEARTEAPARAARNPTRTRPAPTARPDTAALPQQPPGLERAAELADRGELAAAAALCEERLRVAGDDAAAHQLLGVVRQAQGETAAAELCLARALYCDPSRATAMVHLALLLERRGDRAGAARLRRRAARRQEST